ncbi:MAG TPA: long-chain fatty acid--CoA ligase [Chitinophagales bacterium]|nr:long-chain fatty acid--CoA ligase [Chitinophagales bacterium]
MFETPFALTMLKIFDILHHQSAQHPLDDTFARREDKKNWTKYSANSILNDANQLSAGFLKNGLVKGDKIAIICTTNRPEWHVVDIASMQIGLINVPIYPTISAAEYEYIFKHAEIKYVFISDKLLSRKILPILSNLPQIKGIFSFDKLDGVQHWKRLFSSEGIEEIEPIKSNIIDDDIATIIYTSGTTGIPKGVMLTHKNIMSNVLDCAEVVTIEYQDKALSFLPLCHVFERILNYTYMYNGASIYYADGLESISNNLLDIRPQYFASVPRLMEKIYENILRKSRTLSPAKKKIFQWTLKIAENTPIDGRASAIQKFKLAVADRLVLKKWRAAVGGQVKAIICGSAPLQPRLATIFNNAGIPLLEGYGLTETSPVLTVNPFKKYAIKAGSVGPPLPSVQLKIAEDGEILAKAPNVMLGYYKDEKSTQATFTEDGWLKTGDIGHFIENQYLVITDRKKDLFKTSGGKYVAPAVIENKLKESSYIEQVAIVGDGEKFVSALIVPNFEILKNWCKSNNLQNDSLNTMIEHKEVKKLYFNIVQKLNVNFSKVEQIKKIALLENEWTVESGELTPTLKVKRKTIKEKYQSIINAFYK